MKLVITDPEMGRREFSDSKEKSLYLSLIEDQLKLLCKYRDDGRKPSKHLLQDIAVYEFIINSDDPEKYAESYMIEMDRLRSERGFGVEKIQAARNLGWTINENI